MDDDRLHAEVKGSEYLQLHPSLLKSLALPNVSLYQTSRLKHPTPGHCSTVHMARLWPRLYMIPDS